MLLTIVKYKKPILLTTLVLILLVVFYWYRSKGKIEVAEVPMDNINDQASQAEQEKANELARAMYTNFESYNAFNFWYRPLEPFEEFVRVSDKVFVMVYNRFNQLYGMSGNGSLREWFNDDAFSNNDWEFIETIVFPRMDRLNLT